MYTVYALVDPRDNKVHYVGMTEDVYKRFINHITGRSGSNYEKNAWVHGMRNASVMVRMDVLEQTEDIGQAHIREMYWVNHFIQLQHPITNKMRKMPKVAYTPKASIAAIEATLMVAPPQEAHFTQSVIQGTSTPVLEIPQSLPLEVVDDPVPDHPLMDALQIQQFITLYPSLGIEKSLDQIRGCSHKHREHARVIIREQALQRKRG